MNGSGVPERLLQSSWPGLWLAPWQPSSIASCSTACLAKTLGKKLTGVKVYDVSGQRFTMRQAVLRDSVLLSLALFTITVDLPGVLSGRNPYDPANVALSKLGASAHTPLGLSGVVSSGAHQHAHEHPQARAS